MRETWDKKKKEIDLYIAGRKCNESWKFINNVKFSEKPDNPQSTAIDTNPKMDSILPKNND